MYFRNELIVCALSPLAHFNRIATLFRTSKHLKFGAPLMVFVVGIPYFAKDIFQV